MPCYYFPVQKLDRPPNAELQKADTSNEPDIVIGSREQIFHLLAEASEIEHTLMCSYLYVAFSLKDGIACGFSKREADAVEQWRKTIMGVAIEEMGHLLIVSNLTAAIGGRPHFTRPNFPVSPGYFPSGVVLRLNAFSFDTLEHFIFLERPTGNKQADGKGFGNGEHKRDQAHRGLMPSSQDYKTVSHLYEAIRVNLTAFVTRSGSKSLFIGPESGQVDPELIRIHGIGTITDLESVHRAIDIIVEQGEGSPGDREDSHFRRFQAVKQEYADLLSDNPGFRPAYPVAENPVMRRPSEPEGKIYIDAEPAAMILDIANALYGMLLRFLVQAYAQPAAAAPTKERMLAAAIRLMHVLDKTAKALAKLPASLDHPGINAGMTFTMLRGVEPFIGGAAENILILERLGQLSNGTKEAARSVAEMVEVAEKLESLAAQFELSIER